MTIADRSYPLDSVGNTLRKGDLVAAHLSRPTMVFRVLDVRPASQVLTPGADGPVAINGEVVLTTTIPVQFAAGTQLADVFKLVEPETAGGTTLKQ